MLKPIDLESFKDIYEILNKWYFQYNLQNIDKTLFIDSSNGELIPFLELKHKHYEYKNNLVENDYILSMDIFKNIKKIKCIKEIPLIDKYNLIIINNKSVFNKYNSLVDITGYIIYIGNDITEDIPGLILISKDMSKNIHIFQKKESLNTINRSNEFSNLIPIKNKFEFSINSQIEDIDIHAICYYDNNPNEIKVHTIRFDNEESIANIPIKLKLFSVDKTSYQEFEYLQNNLTLDIKTFQTSIPIQPLELNQTKIPKIICQTLENDVVGELHHRTILNLKLMNPEYKYSLFDAYERRQFIQKFFDEVVLDTYDGLVSGAFKADLFRYCWLFLNGGVYIDCKMISRKPLRNIIPSDADYYLVNDRIPNAYQNCFIAIKPKDINILTCISEVVKRFQSKINIRKPFGSLYHTGPYLFYECMKNYKTDALFKAPFQCTNYRDSTLIDNNGNIIFNMWFKNYYLKYSIIHKGNKQWAEQWQNNEIYYSDKFKIENLKDYIVLVYPNQKNTDELKDLSFSFIKNTIYNNKFDKLKCKLIDENNNIERMIVINKYN